MKCILSETSGGDFASEGQRLASFTSWPHMRHPLAHPAALAAAGFHHVPEPGPGGVASDRCLCFCCGLALVSWLPEDEPWAEHRRHATSCAFLSGDAAAGNRKLPLPRLCFGCAPGSGVLWALPACGASEAPADSPVRARAWRAPLPGTRIELPRDAPPLTALVAALDGLVRSKAPSGADALAPFLVDRPAHTSPAAPAPASQFDIRSNGDALGALCALLEEEERNARLTPPPSPPLLPLFMESLRLYLRTSPRGATPGCAASLRACLLRLAASGTQAAAECLCEGLATLWPTPQDQNGLLYSCMMGIAEACDITREKLVVPLPLQPHLLAVLSRSTVLPRFLASSDPSAGNSRRVLVVRLSGASTRRLVSAVSRGGPPTRQDDALSPAEETALVRIVSSTLQLTRDAELLSLLATSCTGVLAAADAALKAGLAPHTAARLLRGSLVCTLLPKALLRALSCNTCDTPAPLTKELSALGAALQQLDSLSPEVLAQECRLSPPGPVLVRHVHLSETVESAHPVDTRVGLERTIVIPGATSLRLLFDPRCSFDRGGAHPQAYVGHTRRRPLLSPPRLPTGPVHVPGNAVTLTCGSGNGREWGLRVTVEPVFGAPAPKVSWLEGLQHLVSAAQGRVLGELASKVTPRARDRDEERARKALKGLLSALNTAHGDGDGLAPWWPLKQGEDIESPGRHPGHGGACV